MERLELTQYDAARVERFASEAELIVQALGDRVRQIEHVGSTAVPGLAGNPTVGFRHQPDETRLWERRFVKGVEFPRAVIVHVVAWQGWKWHEFIRFRDALRADPELASEYEELKRSLLRRGSWYRGVDKRELIERVLAE